MSKVSTLALLKPCTENNRRIDVVEFVIENEDVVSTCRAVELESTSTLVREALPREDQHSPGEYSPPGQRLSAPTCKNYEENSNTDVFDSVYVEEPSKGAVLLEPSLAASPDERDESQPRASTQLGRHRRAKSPEPKFQSFQKFNFDTFRPRPRSHFSSDAMSVWPLRSIEESRLLHHFIQNLAPWVCL